LDAGSFDNTDIPVSKWVMASGKAKRLIAEGLALPGYEMVLKCSHTFNLLDARGAISVTERQAYIRRVRTLAQLVAEAYLESRKRLGFPMVQLQPAKKKRG